VADGVDCVLRLGALKDSELVCRSFGEVPFVTCASSAYLARHGRPATLDELESHVLVNYAPRLPALSSTLEFIDEGQLRRVEMGSSVTVDAAEAYVAAALAGLGLIQVPAYDVRDLLDAGEFVEVLPERRPPSVPLSFLFVRRRNLSPKVRVFFRWLKALLERHGVVAHRAFD